MPQGSILGPLLFINLLPLGHIFHKFCIHFQCYADDIQLYLSSKPNSTLLPFSLSWLVYLKLNNGLHAIFLRLTVRKRLLSGTKLKLKNCETFTLNIDHSVIYPSILRVWLSSLTVLYCCTWTVYYHLQNNKLLSLYMH